MTRGIDDGTAPSPAISSPRDGISTPNMVDFNSHCGGCRQLIDQDNGGIVVAFGSSLWHVDCFRCAKCKDRLTADTNLLLLSDGSPVCGNCSYQCFVCKQAITEEAIMTGDESYHGHCFTCRTCKRRIEELVFAKTTQGIYCMACHNERVARSRRHAEAKRQRAARKEREREEFEARRRDDETRIPASSTSTSLNLLATMSTGSHTPLSSSSLTFPSFSSTKASVGSHDSVKTVRDTDAVSPLPENPELRQRDLSVERTLGSSPMSRSISPAGSRAARSERSLPPSPVGESPSPLMYREKSDGSRSPAYGSPVAVVPNVTPPSSISSRSNNIGLGVGPVPGLGVPTTSKADKRRSINPNMKFNFDGQNSKSPQLVHPPSPLRSSFQDMQIASEQPTARSPLSPALSPYNIEGFPFKDRVLTPPVSVAPFDIPPIPPQKAPLKADTTVERHDTTVDSDNKSKENSNGPQIEVPNIPAMSFSLSDPDFAIILNGIEQSQISLPKLKADLEGSESDMESPHLPTPASPALTRSPQMKLLSLAADADSNLSTARTRLSPPEQPSPPGLLLTRRPSAESNISLGVMSDSAFSTLVELIAAAKPTDKSINVDMTVLTGVIREHELLRENAVTLKTKYTGAKRSSQQYSEGLTVAGEEYDKEVALRHELEAEISRLRAQVHSQTARLSVISGDEKRQENMRRRSNDLANSLTGLERDISRLRAQRDITLAEVEELHSKQGNLDGDEAAATLSLSLTSRLDTIKEQYREELEPLTAQREALQREINELREIREQCLEESTSLAAKNEELAELNSQLSHQTEVMQEALSRRNLPTVFSSKLRTHPSGSPSMSSLLTSATLQDVPEETARVVKVTKPESTEATGRRFKWYKSSKGPDMATGSASISRPILINGDKEKDKRGVRPSTEFAFRDVPHAFQSHGTMRFSRCELCQEKMWGLQEVRCIHCDMVCHAKCAEKLPKSCPGKKIDLQSVVEAESLTPHPPSMFGRELAEQVISDKSTVPVIVTKCIDAVEALGMEYEGIYRKTGGSSQSKQITQLFERGDYDAFDLTNIESFNDISSVTSVLKAYLRSLPNPLLTHALHESFVAAATINNINNKNSAMQALLKELPKDHFNTLRILMMHLNRVKAHSGVNLMTSQNIGVVFGPTLLRSSDPNREFGDMGGKAMAVQWMVDNAPTALAEERE